MTNAFVSVIPALIAYIVPSFSYAELSPTLHRITRLLPVNVIGNIDQVFSMADFYSFFGALVDRKMLIVIVSVVIISVLSVLSAVFFLRKEPSK